MRTRKKKPSQSNLRLLGVQPDLQAVRYAPDGQRATVRQLTAESRRRLSTEIFTRRHTNSGTTDSEGEAT